VLLYVWQTREVFHEYDFINSQEDLMACNKPTHTDGTVELVLWLLFKGAIIKGVTTIKGSYY